MKTIQKKRMLVFCIQHISAHSNCNANLVSYIHILSLVMGGVREKWKPRFLLTSYRSSSEVQEHSVSPGKQSCQ